MNIIQKNTLFVVVLVVLVLAGVSLSGYLLIRNHVEAEIDRDLERAQRVFVEAQKRAFDRLVTAARAVSREPALLAAARTGDPTTLRGMLEDAYPQPGIDLLAVFPRWAPATAAGRKPHFGSPQLLAAESMQQLVRQVGSGAGAAFGNALALDTFLRLTAIPVESPRGGAIGVLVAGEEFRQAAVDELKLLLRADVALYAGNLLLGATLPVDTDDLAQLSYVDERRAPLRFDADGISYFGHVYPVFAADGRTPVAHVLLAHSADSYWAPYRELGKSGLVIAVLILVIAALVGVGVTRATLTRPIMALAEATRYIAAGDLTHQVRVRRRDELGQLASSFNHMLADLSTSQAELERNRQRFHDFAESSSDWLWETDHGGRFVYVSSGVTETLGMSPDSFIGRTLAEVFPRDDLAGIMDRLVPAEDCRCMPFKEFECSVTLHDGVRRHLRLNGMPILSDGVLHGYRGTTRDVSKAKQDEERLAVLSNQDQLTGLANRRRFLIDLAHEIRHAQSRHRSGILMLIDLDHIKLVNDTAGHSVGDELIVQIADVLGRLCRSEDLLARLSGDEFAMAFPDMDTQQAQAKARAVLDAIAEHRPLHKGKALRVSASIGVVPFPESAGDAVELLAKADTAMYAAKDAGRNRAKFYAEGDMARERMGSQLAWKTRLVEALENDLFELVFQPIAALVDGAVHHFETLVRMRDRDGSCLMPGNFIPTAEQFGLIGQVDRVIVAKALRYLAALPGELSSIGISINLSGMSVGDDEVLSLIESELRGTGIDPRRVTFEVTETAACAHMAKAAEFIARIRQLGCRISLDDFGVGFSSFSYLKNLHVDTLKIDGSFIRDITRSRDDQLFVKALVDVARGMGIRTIAEFVETSECMELLRRLGVDYVQGYFVGRPASAITPLRLGLPGAAGTNRAAVI